MFAKILGAILGATAAGFFCKNNHVAWRLPTENLKSDVCPASGNGRCRWQAAQECVFIAFTLVRLRRNRST